MTAPAGNLPPDGSLNFTVELRCAIAKALRNTQFSRTQVVERMAALLGVDVSEAMLDAWSAPSRSRWRFPFEYAAAFDAACETTALLELLARQRDYRVLAPGEVKDAELGRIEREISALRARRATLITAHAIEEDHS